MFWYPALKKFQEFIITILLILLLLSFSGLLYWSNDPLILFCWLYRWSFKAAVKCAIKSSRQLTGLIYKQMRPVINKRLKWSNGGESFYIKSSNLSLSPQPSEPLCGFCFHYSAFANTKFMYKKWSLQQGLCWYILEMLLGSWPREMCKFSHVVQLCWSSCSSPGSFPGTPRSPHSSHLPGCYKQDQECLKGDVKISNSW